ncbi:hypothetical protein PHG31p207 [Aeromonas phage 31]|uniref:Uncharacterized protein n=4 Tax=Biquartavirus TaxID=1912143 RepID=Q6U992_9CAUD|nr:hypothetical protein ST44RRORF210c [Aeromonas phage 44RR2.8t]YP_238936.1 hypothetical protein PHG31p207 [Aeromonas phage 31]APU00682.1 hypothetical protein [Aeromonas phage 44RR2.8t.2]APU01101.1 hypothetical protein [Aeromonas phage 31.2]APU02011.1 hypothetical protein [Aeromonas phage L9-6]APU02262.1 hypothetical protein [Aeromonas phage Riv-10]APU02510.1 hypothetical protein [Aeromonas phage SW69-9]UYD59763.1 hypothetical protein JNMOADIG_00251 [Aeromonas phage avDM5]UYD60507.1 hypothe
MTYDEWLDKNREHVTKFISENVWIDITEIRRDQHEVAIHLGDDIIAKDTIYV